MLPALIGKKIGMTRLYDETGRDVPVTIIEAGQCHVGQIKTADTDGYDAVQFAFEDIKARNSTMPLIGHDAKAGLGPRRFHREFRGRQRDQQGQGLLRRHEALGLQGTAGVARHGAEAPFARFGGRPRVQSGDGQAQEGHSDVGPARKPADHHAKPGSFRLRQPAEPAAGQGGRARTEPGTGHGSPVGSTEQDESQESRRGQNGLIPAEMNRPKVDASRDDSDRRT